MSKLVRTMPQLPAFSANLVLPEQVSTQKMNKVSAHFVKKLEENRKKLLESETLF